jgi:hypothetical protein
VVDLREISKGLIHFKFILNKINHQRCIARIVPVDVRDHFAADAELVHFLLQGIAELRAMDARALIAILDQISQ